MLKRTKIIIVGIVFVLLIGWTIRENILIRQREEEEALKIEQFNMDMANLSRLHILCMSGTFNYEPPDKIIVLELERNQTGTIANVMLYNAFHKGEELTVEQVLQEYDAYCDNTLGEYEGLDAMLTFERRDDYYKTYSSNSYTARINVFLYKKYNIIFPEEATEEQAQEAAEYAIKVLYEDTGVIK